LWSVKKRKARFVEIVSKCLVLKDILRNVLLRAIEKFDARVREGIEIGDMKRIVGPSRFLSNLKPSMAEILVRPTLFGICKVVV
jgi:hypothetical protein